MTPDHPKPSKQEAHPDWEIPFWMMLALAMSFLLGCVCGGVLMEFLRGNPFGVTD